MTQLDKDVENKIDKILQFVGFAVEKDTEFSEIYQEYEWQLYQLTKLFSQELAAAKKRGAREERERLTKNALESHNPDYLPSWAEKQLTNPSVKEQMQGCIHQWFEIKNISRASDKVKRVAKLIDEDRRSVEKNGYTWIPWGHELLKEDVFGVLVKCGDCEEQKELWESSPSIKEE